MRTLPIPVLASMLLIAAPAVAQTTGGSQAHQSNQGATSSMPNGSKINAQTQAALRHSLQQSGFKNIQIVAESYAVRALAPDGSHVVMMVSPNEVEGVVLNGQNNGTSQPQNGSGTSNAPHSGGASSSQNKQQ